MKNYSSSENKIDAGNAFALNRLGLSDTLGGWKINYIRLRLQ
jgi:hypothetical protein